MNQGAFYQTRRIVGVLMMLTLIGIAWFWLYEGWTLLDAAYMTIITLTTVGYREVHPLSVESQIFLMIYLICGLGIFLFAVVALGELIVRAELTGWLRRRELSKVMKSMNDHYVICGFGRMGESVCEQLANGGAQFVVIDEDEDAIAECDRRGWIGIRGDATEDRVLEDAGIKRARGLAAVLSSDADNLYTVLSARLLAPTLQITARASDQSNVRKMERAGADRVVCLHAAGARTMAQVLINPRVEDFFEVAASMGSTMDLTEVRIGPDSKYAGKTLRETDFRRRGIVIVAIQRDDQTLQIAPPADFRIQQGDRLIAFGSASAISDFLQAEQQETS